MKQLYFIVACMCMIWLAACSDMNDVHDIYLKNGDCLYRKSRFYSCLQW